LNCSVTYPCSNLGMACAVEASTDSGHGDQVRVREV
jgi:predicted small metal-binding protein